MKPERVVESIIPIVTLLFFLQALRVVFSVMFGFIYDQVFEGPMDAWLVIGNVLVFMAMVLPAWVNRNPSWRWMVALAVVASASRAALSVDDIWVRYWGALLVIISTGAFVVTLIRLDLRRTLRALVMAIVIEQLLRAVGHTTDVSLDWTALPFLALWIMLLLVLSLWVQPWSGSERAQLNGISWGIGAAIGGFLFIETSLLGLPNAIARWSGVSYTLVAPLLVLITILPLYPGVLSVVRQLLKTKFIRMMVVVISTGGLLLGYFLSGILAMSLLLLSQWLSISMLLMLGELETSTSTKAGGRLALGLLLFLILNFVNAFAFTYAYTLPFMRSMGWLVYLISGLAAAWGLGSSRLLRSELDVDHGAFYLALATMVAFVIVMVSVWPMPVQAMPAEGRRLATYNIHYGYDDDWHTTLPEIAAAISDSGADVVALQEVDTGRMTSYSTDNAYYLARTLRMNVYYLPTVEHLTGIAVLFKGEAIDIDARLLTSLQEQTGVIEVLLPWGEEQIHAYGIWMGLSNEDTLRQAEEALAFIGENSPATFGGDFNSQIDDPEPRAIMAAGFADPFSELGQEPAPPTSPAVNPETRIDFVWLRGLEPVQAFVSESLASDHRMVVVEVNPP